MKKSQSRNSLFAFTGRKPPRREGGFTLIELMIVMTIILI